MTVWNGTWKPDGTGGWHTKSDIVDQYNSARLTPAPAQMLKDAIDEVVRLRERLAEADEANRRVSDENEKLRKALKPFAEHASLLDDFLYDADDTIICGFDDRYLTAGDVRAAAAALKDIDNGNV